MSAKLEHPVDRQLRRSALYGYRVKFDFSDHNSYGHEGFWSRLDARGHRWEYTKNPVTELITCELCGKLSTPKKVHSRSRCWGWNLDRENYGNPDIKEKSVLCCGCWNKVKPIVKRQEEADEMKRILNQFKKEISHERKNRNNRTNAGFSGHDDGRCAERRP